MSGAKMVLESPAVAFHASPALERRLCPDKVRDVARVTLSKPADGTRRRRKPRPPVGRSSKVARTMVNEMIWAYAQEHCGEHQRIVIVSADEVLIVNKKER